MTLPYDKKVAASRMSQIQSTGSNPSLLPIHIALPPDFFKGYYVSFPTVVFFFSVGVVRILCPLYIFGLVFPNLPQNLEHDAGVEAALAGNYHLGCYRLCF